MTFLEFIKGRIDTAGETVNKFLSNLSGDPTPGDRKPEGDSGIGSWVKDLYDEAQKYYSQKFAETKDSRFNSISDPISFLEAVQKLEAGNDWDVIGHRNKDQNETWKQEIVDPEIQRQIRVKSAYNTSEWHDIVITPNVSGISDILDQERSETDWGQAWKERVKMALMYGGCHIMSILDKDENPDGIATEVTAEPNSVFYNPYAKSKKKSDGCWYVVWAKMENADWVKKNSDIPVSELSSASGGYIEKFLFQTRKTTQDFSHTKLYPVIHCYMDDDTTEFIPPEEWAHNPKETQLEFATMLEGGSIKASPDDNQYRHVEEHKAQMQSIHDLAQKKQEDGDLSPDEINELQSQVSKLDDHIQEHSGFMQDPSINQRRTRPKYPNGRYILTICDKVAEDIPNPYLMPWRMLVHNLPNEKVPGRLDGRGVPEILYPDEKAADMALSRNADLALLQTPKPMLPISEKNRPDQDGYDNDPTKPYYFNQQPPQYRPVPSMPANIESYTIHKNNLRDALGIDKVSMGQSTGSHSSAKKEQFLASQNAMIVQGELNQNLNDVIRDVIQTRLEMYKLFYKRPRTWFIGGKPTVVNLSRALSVMQVTDEKGNVTEAPIQSFQVFVKPESNFPYKWEKEINELLQFYSVQKPDGTPLIAVDAIIDMLESKYPRLALYRQMDKATAIGMQILKQQQEQAEKDQKFNNKIEDKFKSKALSLVIKGNVVTQ